MPSFMVDSLKRDGLYYSDDQLLTAQPPPSQLQPLPSQPIMMTSENGDGDAGTYFEEKSSHPTEAEYPIMAGLDAMATDVKVAVDSHNQTTMSRVSSASKLSRGQVLQESTPRDVLPSSSQLPVHLLQSQAGGTLTIHHQYPMNTQYEDFGSSHIVPPLALSSETLSHSESPDPVLPKSTSLPNVPSAHKGLSITIPNKPLPSRFPVFSPEDQPRPPLGPPTAEVLSQTYDLHQVVSDTMTFLPTSDSEESMSIQGRRTMPSHIKLLPPEAFVARSDRTPVSKRHPRLSVEMRKPALNSSLSSGSSMTRSPRDGMNDTSPGKMTLLSPADEMVYIRDTLQRYQQDKQKYRYSRGLYYYCAFYCFIAVLSALVCQIGPCYHIEAETKWPTVCTYIFKCLFFNENCCILIEIP